MTARVMDAAVATALGNDNVPLAVLVELDLPSAPVRAWSGLGELVWSGKIFLGVGSLGKISPLEEGDDLRARGFSLSLSGIPPEMLSLSLQESYQGRRASIWIAVLNSDYQLVANPIGPWIGRIDTQDGELGETATVTINVESRLIDWERPRIRRYTDADQQLAYPGDRGCEFVSQMVEKELVWGRG